MIPPRKKFNVGLVERWLSSARERVPDQRQYIFSVCMENGGILMLREPASMRVESL
jgi:hypothetical protein